MIRKWIKFCFTAALTLGASLGGLIIKNIFFTPRQFSFPEELPPECASFKLIHGTLSNASTVFLGEFHDRREESVDCFTALVSNNGLLPHTVYVEGRESGKICLMSLSLLGVHQCEGWDNMQLLSQFWVEEEKWVKDPRLIEKMAHNDTNPVRSLQHLRNQSLLKTIKNKPHNRHAGVIVGRAHLIKTPAYNTPDYADAEFIQNELRNDPNNAVIVMKRFDTETSLKFS